MWPFSKKRLNEPLGKYLDYRNHYLISKNSFYSSKASMAYRLFVWITYGNKDKEKFFEPKHGIYAVHVGKKMGRANRIDDRRVYVIGYLAYRELRKEYKERDITLDSSDGRAPA